LLTLFHTIHQWHMMMMTMMVLFSFCLQGHCWVHMFLCMKLTMLCLDVCVCRDVGIQ
jgi:hypothetical protein